jgi:hypothetical protein
MIHLHAMAREESACIAFGVGGLLVRGGAVALLGIDGKWEGMVELVKTKFVLTLKSLIIDE